MASPTQTLRVTSPISVQSLSEIEQSAAELLMIYHISLSDFKKGAGGTYFWMVLRNAWTKLYQIWGEHRAIIKAHQVCFRCQISCSILKHGQVKVELCQKLRPNCAVF